LQEESGRLKKKIGCPKNTIQTAENFPIVKKENEITIKMEFL